MHGFLQKCNGELDKFIVHVGRLGVDKFMDFLKGNNKKHHHQVKKYYIHDSEDHFEEEDGNTELVQIGAERTKDVLILMSDVGGGLRAAEAIRDAFKLEYGDECRMAKKCSLKDLTPRMLNLALKEFGYIVLTTTASIMVHEEARRKNIGGKIMLWISLAISSMRRRELILLNHLKQP